MIEKTVLKEKTIVLQYSKSIHSSAMNRHYEVARKQEYLVFDSRQ